MSQLSAVWFRVTNEADRRFFIDVALSEVSEHNIACEVQMVVVSTLYLIDLGPAKGVLSALGLTYEYRTRCIP